MLLSVIVPVFNLENVIIRCLLSIQMQTYKNFEVIIINDGSVDNSEMFIKDFIITDSRFKLITTTNKGLSAARNNGIENCIGEIVSFIDGDDYIDPFYFENVVSKFITSSSDLVITNLNRITSLNFSKKLPPLMSKNIRKISRKYALSQLIFTKIDSAACGKFYLKKTLLDNSISFPEGKIFEDGFFTYKAFYFSKKIYFSDFNGYFYINDRPQSIMNTKLNTKSLTNLIEALEQRNLFFKQRNDYYFSKISTKVYYRTLITLYSTFNSNMEFKSNSYISSVFNSLNIKRIHILKLFFTDLIFVKFFLFFYFNPFFNVLYGKK
jgi:glycosyltransferase involved in cell wall biosynthesis